MKWDHAGNKLWNSTWGGSDTEAGWDITGDGAGGIYTAGSTSTYGPFPGTQNALVVKWDATNGNEIWNATWGDALDDYATGIWANTSVIYTCGTTQSFGAGSNDACLVKWSSSNGARFWNYTWGGISSDRANDLVLANNSLFTAGSTSSFGEGSSDVAVVRWSLDGAVLWNRTQGTPESEEATAIATDPAENAIYMTGDLYENTYYYLTLIKFGVNGNLLHNETWPGYFSDNNGFGEAIAANGSTIFVAGASDSFGASYDFEFALLRYDGDEYQSDPPFISHVPDAPVLITPSQTIETDSITIQWHAVIGSNWYYLYVNGERTQILSGDDIEVVLRFLTSGTYKIWLTAVNASGESLPSNIITIQVDLPKFDFNLILLIFILCAAAVIIFGSLWSIRKKSREQPEKDEKFEDLFY